MNFIIENFQKPKTILMVLGLTAVIVFSVILVGYESYLRTTTTSTSTCTQHFEVRDENNKPIASSQVAVGGSSCATNYNGNCSMKLKTNETHIARASKSGYQCYDNRCSKTFTGCPPEWIPLFLKKTASTTTCTDPDGENLFIKGTTKQITGGHTSTYYDQCQNGKVHEWYCVGNQAEVKNISCPAGYSCVGFTDGKCTKDPEPKCEADGKCKTFGCPNGDPDCTCLQQSGKICQTDETCPGTSLKHSRSGICCSVACTPAAIYSISGRIISSEDISSSRIAINLTGTSSASTVTDSSGSYSFNNLINGSYTIAPSDGTWIISPVSQNVTISSSNVSGISFTAIKKECNLGEKKNHICPDGTEVNWCTCDNYKWACIDSPENNCPATCEADGKCKTSGCPTGDPDCSCSEYEPSGFICQAGETCLGISLTHSGSGICCSVACEGSAVHQTADLNCNGSVNLTDDAILMSFWHKDPFGFDSCQSPDIDQDGDVDLADLAIMMSQWTEMAF